MRALLLLLLAVALPARAAERLEQIPSARPGITLRVLVDRPEGTPRGAVMLLAGGDGHLGITDAGEVTWLVGNQLVRSRARYVAAGWITALPDVARDMPSGNRQMGYRITPQHAEDLAAVLAWLRHLTPRVVVVGTSAGTLSASNVTARLAPALRPAALVLTSGMLMPSSSWQPSVAGGVAGLDTLAMPVLLLHHTADACPVTPPDGPAQFAPLLKASPRVDIVMLSGGSGVGNPCESQASHGFRGMDEEVVGRITTWLAGLSP